MISQIDNALILFWFYFLFNFYFRYLFANLLRSVLLEQHIKKIIEANFISDIQQYIINSSYLHTLTEIVYILAMCVGNHEIEMFYFKFIEVVFAIFFLFHNEFK